MLEETDDQRPAGSSDISADADRKRRCLGARWVDGLFSRYQPGQMKPRDPMLPPPSIDALTL